MNIEKTKRIAQVFGLALAISASTANNPLRADDTELYTAVLDGGFSEQIRPNILYIIDTSGSMDSEFTFINPREWHNTPYDPHQEYPHEDPLDCDPDRIYYIGPALDQVNPDGTHNVGTHGYPMFANGSIKMPRCTNSTGTAPSTTYFPENMLVCKKAIDAISDPEKGWYFDRWGEHIQPTGTFYLWVSLLPSRNAQNIPRECNEDWGLHGETDGAQEKYPATNEAGWVDAPDHPQVRQLNRSTDAQYIVASGNYLNWFYSAPRTRIAAVQIALRDVIRKLPDDVNVGIMRFDAKLGSDSTDGGMMLKEFVHVGVGSNREDLVDALLTIPSTPDSLTGATPLAETLLEAFYVFNGERVYFGAGSENEFGPFPSVATSREPGSYPAKYISPITESCQQNHIIYFTDGAADSDTSVYDGTSEANSAARWQGGMDGLLPSIEEYMYDDCNVSNAADSDACLPVLAGYMFHEDVSTDITTGVPGTQTVTTHTIGFDDGGSDDSSTPPDPDYLRLTADNGGGTFHMVSNTDEIKDAFSITTRQAVIANTAFTAPALAVNAFNRTRDENRVYFAMFKSSVSPGWGGNLKAYQFGRADDDDSLVIVDADENPAVDEDSGEFFFDARSIWSSEEDGNEAPEGGAASNLPEARNLYTWFGDDNNPSLRALEYEFTPGNAAITPAMLGMTGGEPFSSDDLINWMRGMDVQDVDGDGNTTEQRLHMGDPLHSRPNVVTYGGTAGDPQQRVFLTTNDGFLHVIDAASGQETFGFIADETLKNAKRLFMNDTSAGKNYGLDGVPVLYVDEAGTEDPGISGGDKVYLYTGMRRGGRSYYAFDFTDPDDPEILWRIQGGSGDFDRLGYTFSAPRTGEIKIDGEVRKILVFGGGYDLDQDHPEGTGSTRDSYLPDDLPDDYGNAIYIVDALTGARLWWASSVDGADLRIDEMVNSIPSDIALVDADNDGWSDRIYVGDTGGRVFRIDIKEFSENGIESWGGMIADLGASDVANDPDTPEDEAIKHNRKFFYAPDVSIVENGVDDYLAIAIGSGNRAHPSYPITGGTATEDAFFVLKDTYILGRPPGNDYDYGIVFGDDDILFDAADDTPMPSESKGWYLTMEHEGEKVLAESTTFNYTVMFTSFEPRDIDLSTCQGRTGIGRLYALNLRNGNPVFANFGGDEDELTADDRSYVLVRDGIPPAPTLAFPDGTGVQSGVMVGPEMPPVPPPSQLRRSYWMIP